MQHTLPPAHQRVLELLNSNSLNDFIAGIELVRDTYHRNRGEIRFDQEIMEKTLSVLIYEKVYEHQELLDTIKAVMDALPRHLYLMENEDHKHTLIGVSVFVNGLPDGRMDFSGFYFAYSEDYIAAYLECRKLAGIIAGQYPEDAAALEAFADVLEAISGTQMTATGMIRAFRDWDEDTCTAFKNIFFEASPSEKYRMLNNLEYHLNNKAVSEHIITPYENALRATIEKYTQEGKDGHREAVEKVLEELHEIFYQSRGKTKEFWEQKEWENNYDDEEEDDDEEENDGDADTDDGEKTERWSDEEIRQMIRRMAMNRASLTAETIQPRLAAHREFVRNGGAGGRFERLELDMGMPLIVYVGKNAPEEGQLKLNQWAIAPGTDLSGCNFEYANMAACVAEKVNFSGCNFSNAIITDALLSGSDFTGAILYEVDFSDSDLSNACFRNADLRSCDFERANCTGADFTGANMSYVQFKKTILDDIKY